MRRWTHASCGADRDAERHPSGPCLLRFCRPGRGSDRTSAELLYRPTAFFTLDRDPARWTARVYDAAPRHRVARGSRDLRGFEGGLRPLLRQACRGPIIIADRAES